MGFASYLEDIIHLADDCLFCGGRFGNWNDWSRRTQPVYSYPTPGTYIGALRERERAAVRLLGQAPVVADRLHQVLDEIERTRRDGADELRAIQAKLSTCTNAPAFERSGHLKLVHDSRARAMKDARDLLDRLNRDDKNLRRLVEELGLGRRRIVECLSRLEAIPEIVEAMQRPFLSADALQAADEASCRLKATVDNIGELLRGYHSEVLANLKRAKQRLDELQVQRAEVSAFGIEQQQERRPSANRRRD